jgi:creatinine amidohydrolase
MLAVTCSWSRFGYPDGLFDPQELDHGIHGGAIETSIMLAAYPDLVRIDRIADFPSRSIAMERRFRWLRPDDPVGFGWMTQDLHASGALGDARSTTAAKGEAAVAHGAKAFIELLREVQEFQMSESDSHLISEL